MRHELFEEGKNIVAFAAGSNHARLMVGYWAYRHGIIESRVLKTIFEKQPQFLQGEQSENVEFGVSLHDIGKITCVSEPFVWTMHTKRFTELDFSETQAHIDEGVKLAKRAKSSGYYMPPIALAIIQYHQELHDGTGLKGVPAGGLPLPVQTAIIVDYIVACCENRTHRYDYPQLSFQSAWQSMHEQHNFNESIMEAVKGIFFDHPLSGVKGLGWVPNMNINSVQ